MTTAANEIDFLAVLFAGETRTADEVAADMEAARAVKRYRELTGASLKLAIDYVDSLKGANHG